MVREVDAIGIKRATAPIRGPGNLGTHQKMRVSGGRGSRRATPTRTVSARAARPETASRFQDGVTASCCGIPYVRAARREPRPPKERPSGPIETLSRFALSIVVGIMMILLAACSERRATGPGETAPIPAMQLLDTGVIDFSLIVERSKSVAPERNPSTGEFTFSLGDLPIVAEDRVDDIQLHFKTYDCPYTYDCEIWMPEQLQWRWVERESGIGDRPCSCIPNHWCTFYRLLSNYRPVNVSEFLDTDGRLRVRAEKFQYPWARAIEYAPQYHFVTVAPAGPALQPALAYTCGELWVSRAFVCTGEELADSLFVIDVDGTRKDALSLCPLRILSMCADARGRVWAITRSPDPELLQISRQGEILASLPFTDDIAMAIAWWDDHLWYVSGANFDYFLRRIDVSSSESSGHVVTDGRIDLASETKWPSAVFFKDSTIHAVVSTNLWRFSLQGRVISKQPIPVYFAGGIACDGTSMWMLHYGPLRASGSAVLLSRFNLP